MAALNAIYKNSILYCCDGCQLRIESLEGKAHLICVNCNQELRKETEEDWKERRKEVLGYLESSDILAQMVRDFTTIGPRPKSEVRRRILDYVTSASKKRSQDGNTKGSS